MLVYKCKMQDGATKGLMERSKCSWVLRQMRIHVSQQHSPGVFDVLFDLHQKLYSLSAIEKTMIVGQCQIHHRSNDNLAVDNHGFFLNRMKSEHSGLRKVDDGSTHQRTEHSAIADSEGSTSHILNCEFVVTSLDVQSVNMNFRKNN